MAEAVLVTSVLTLTAHFSSSETSASAIENILQVFKIFKLVRIAKLIRHSTGLQAIAVTLIRKVEDCMTWPEVGCN